MRLKLMTVAIALGMISAATAYSRADADAMPNDPVEVVRASAKARLTGGDWRVYLSKRWQDVVTPTVMNDLNNFYVIGPSSRHKDDAASTAPKDANTFRVWATNRDSFALLSLDNARLVEATDTTAVVEVHGTSPDAGDKRKTEWTPRQYLIKEDGRWAIDSPFDGARPQWAIPADLKPVYTELAPIVQQYFDAIYDDHGAARHDDAALEAYAKQHLSEESLISVGVKLFVEKNCLGRTTDKAARDKYLDESRLLSPIAIDVRKSEMVGQTEQRTARAWRICCFPNDKGGISTVSGVRVFPLAKEHGEWKLVFDPGPREFVPRFLDLWRDQDKDTMGKLLAPDAKFDMGTGKCLTWAEMSRNLPVLAKWEPVTDIYSDDCFTLSFANDGKSGVYEISCSRTNPTRITSIRYMTQDKIAAKKEQWHRQMEATAPKPVPEPVKPVPLVNGKLLPPPASLPIELRGRGDRGGIYFDDILLTNNGKVVFFEDFQGISMLSSLPSGHKARGQSAVSKACCLYLTTGVSDMGQVISIQHPGVIELSAWVWLPPASEQAASTFTYLRLYSASSHDAIGVGVQEDGRGKGYFVKLLWNRSDGDDKEVQSKGSALQSGRWARLKLRLESASGKASAILDNVTQASVHYAPSNFRTFSRIFIMGCLAAAKKPKWQYGGTQRAIWVSGNHGTAAGKTKYEMIDLGALAHLSESEAIAINNDGLVLFGDQFFDSVSLFLWRNGKLTSLKNQKCSFVALNDLGQIVGETITKADKSGGTAVIWQNGKRTQLSAIGTGEISPSAINNKGQIAGCGPTANGCRAAVWDKGHVRVLPIPDWATDSCACDINSSGRVIGRVDDARKASHAYLWQASKGLDLGTLPTCTQSEGASINGSGHVVGNSYGPDGWDTGNGDVRSFVWSNGVMRDIGSILGGNRIFANGINNHDDVVGWARRADGETRGFLLRNGTVTDLEVLPKGMGSKAYAINDKGWIIGTGTTANGKEHAVLWRPIGKAK
jgi:probable HAF family extracellular repeat protein